jgi:hypothetical protein
MPQPMSNTVVFSDGASSSSKAWHNISAPCTVFQRFFTGGSCNSKPATVSWRLGAPITSCTSGSLMSWLWIDTLFVIPGHKNSIFHWHDITLFFNTIPKAQRKHFSHLATYHNSQYMVMATHKSLQIHEPSNHLNKIFKLFPRCDRCISVFRACAEVQWHLRGMKKPHLTF